MIPVPPAPRQAGRPAAAGARRARPACRGCPASRKTRPTTTSMSCPWPGCPRPLTGTGCWSRRWTGQPGGGFTAQHLHRHELRAHGGDVLVRVAPDTGARGSRPSARRCGRSWEARLVLAGNWDRQSPDDWAEQVRPAVAFAMGTITELEESGADLGPCTGSGWMTRTRPRSACRSASPPAGPRRSGPGGLIPGRPRSRGQALRAACSPLPLSRHPAGPCPPARAATAGRRSHRPGARAAAAGRTLPARSRETRCPAARPWRGPFTRPVSLARPVPHASGSRPGGTSLSPAELKHFSETSPGLPSRTLEFARTRGTSAGRGRPGRPRGR